MYIWEGPYHGKHKEYVNTNKQRERTHYMNDIYEIKRVCRLCGYGETYVSLEKIHSVVSNIKS